MCLYFHLTDLQCRFLKAYQYRKSPLTVSRRMLTMLSDAVPLSTLKQESCASADIFWPSKNLLRNLLQPPQKKSVLDHSVPQNTRIQKNCRRFTLMRLCSMQATHISLDKKTFPKYTPTSRPLYWQWSRRTKIQRNLLSVLQLSKFGHPLYGGFQSRGYRIQVKSFILGFCSD